MRTRIDKLLVERGLAPTRERAQAMILAGRVLANDQKVEKAGTTVDENSSIRLLGDDMPFVSRGGLKLQRALEYWSIDCNQKTGLDIGTSTGGFTDCLLQHGAKQVIAVDTGYGQIDMRLRSDPRVRLLEKTNARYLEAGHVPEDIDIIVMDVSFISATLVLPAVLRSIRRGRPEHSRELIVLVKPQFEVGRELVGKGGIVRDPGVQQGAVEKVQATVVELGGGDINVIDSPILGTEGNKEFLLHAVFGQSKDLKVE
jgi:23S rRNA (cytidine1920-2'-O)/16S rRNA (cytidine1409-2'-O)-methyltransferase